jgi:hypothetical protein
VRRPRVRFTVRAVMLAVAVVALIYPTFVTIVVAVARRPEAFRPPVLLEAAFRSPEGGSIAVVSLLIVAWSAALTAWVTARALKSALSAGWRKPRREAAIEGGDP